MHKEEWDDDLKVKERVQSREKWWLLWGNRRNKDLTTYLGSVFRAQHHEPNVILGSKLLPWGMKGGLEKGNAVECVSQRENMAFWAEGGVRGLKALVGIKYLSLFSLKNFTCDNLFLWENQNIQWPLPASAICEVTLLLSRTELCPVIPTSWKIKGQLIKSKATNYFGSYPSCRMLSRLYAQFSNFGKTQRSLNLTLLVLYCASNDSLL